MYLQKQKICLSLFFFLYIEFIWDAKYETAQLGITNSRSRGEQMAKGSHAIYHQQNSVFNEIEGLMTSRDKKALDAKMCNLGHGQGVRWVLQILTQGYKFSTKFPCLTNH